jgi:hypothetical protein
MRGSESERERERESVLEVVELDQSESAMGAHVQYHMFFLWYLRGFHKDNLAMTTQP